MSRFRPRRWRCICHKAPRAQKRTQSVRNGIPTRSMGTMVFCRTAIVPYVALCVVSTIVVEKDFVGSGCG
ncbi:hypothetical protein CCL24_02020 [Pseudomonas congelans]|nr:hypothetical protein CCL24_02020 [Pseudomonas congelans]